MEVIHIHHPHRLDRTGMPELAIALGYFDGVHLGHQKVIREAKSSLTLFHRLFLGKGFSVWSMLLLLRRKLLS